jgi:hypothetical protein
MLRGAPAGAAYPLWFASETRSMDISKDGSLAGVGRGAVLLVRLAPQLGPADAIDVKQQTAEGKVG